MALAGAASPAVGQAVEGDSAAEKTQPDSMSEAPVVLDGNLLFRVYGLEAYPASRRAEEIRGRIVALAKNPAFDVTTVTAQSEPHATKILAGDQPILSVFDQDAVFLGVTREVAVRLCLIKIREAIEQYRADRQPQQLRRGIFRAGGATALFLLLLFLILRAFDRLHRWIERNFKHRIQALKVGSFELIHAEQIYQLYWGFLGTFRLMALLVLFYLYLEYVLRQFPWTRGIAAQMSGWVVDPLKTMGQGFFNYLPKLAFLVVLVLVLRFALQLIRLFFSGLGQGSVSLSGFEAEWAKPTFSLVRILIIAFGVIVAYPYIPGSQSGAFKGVSIFLGLLVSLGATSAISNIIAGYTMIYRRTFKLGDRIQIGEHTGYVTAMRLLTTELQTIKNERVVVPNSQILNTSVVNYSTLAAEKGLILHTSVGIGYETPWRQVDAMLKIAADQTPGLLKDPMPFVLKKSLGDFAVNYEINAYCHDARNIAQIYADLHENILEQFNEYGVQIMTPAYEGDPDQPKVPPKDQWYAAPAENFFPKRDKGR